LLAYAEANGIPIAKKKDGGSPYSMDANALHISYEGGGLEDPWWCPPEDLWLRTTNPVDAPDEPQYVTISYENGDPVAVDGKALSPFQVLDTLNRMAGRHGIGRLDIVENRYVGIKSRGCYETPGGTLMLKAHRAIESITLDREQAHLKDELMPRYASLIYNGYWWSPERRALQALVDDTQRKVNGEVRLKLYKGHVYNAGRRSPDSLFDERLSTFEDDQGAYNQKDAEGFIRLNSLRLRTVGKRDNH
ncbi:MAG: argininosuccinate synthase, partial [Sinobacteraceae bacterium]|nr:argininosuccinate synthase [Nevskiaceae bacterium]